MSRYRFTSESVTEGHPDKLCDAISDSVLDAILAQDKKARVACESLAKTGMVVVAGEITTHAVLDHPAIVRKAVREIGYTSSEMGFDADTVRGPHRGRAAEPGHLARGDRRGRGSTRSRGGRPGAHVRLRGQRGPQPDARRDRLRPRGRGASFAAVRKAKKVDFLRPDGKTQVTLEYENDRPARIDAVVVSTQHDDEVKYKHLREAVIETRDREGAPEEAARAKNTKFHVNPTGRFVIGGPQGDCGLTGRKIIVDTYGGMGRHVAAARSAGRTRARSTGLACYYARFIAKNVVASGVARKCEVQIAYAIGVARPVGVRVDTFGTGKISDEKLEAYILEHFDMRPKALIDELGLLAPICCRPRRTATSGGASLPGRRPAARRRLRAISSAASRRGRRSPSATGTGTRTATARRRTRRTRRRTRRRRSKPRPDLHLPFGTLISKSSGQSFPVT